MTHHLPFTPMLKRMQLAALAMTAAALTSCESNTPLRTPTAALAPDALMAPAALQTFFTGLGWTLYMNWEYTDDQRFHVNGAYGPVAFIAPSDNVATYSLANFSAAGAQGLLVAVVRVDTTATTPITLSDAYTELQLKDGFNCVWISNTPSWSAYAVPAANTVNPCPATTPPATRLKVYAVSPPSDLPPGDNVPPTARFHEGTRGGNNRPFIGIKCATFWCMVLPQTGDSIPLAHKGHKPRMRKWEAHGWHDVQTLMVLDNANKPKLSDLVGSIVPDSALESFTIPTNFDTGYVHVATIHFKKKPRGPYADKWGLVKGDNELFLKRDPTSASGWKAQVRHYWVIFGQVVRTFSTDLKSWRHPHATNPGSHNPPGAARFRWDDVMDEGLWVRCDVGCCKVAPE